MAKHRNSAYTEEFRKEAVRLASLTGRTAVSVAKELRVLRRENTRLKDEMEFLKKVSAYFAKQQE